MDAGVSPVALQPGIWVWQASPSGHFWSLARVKPGPFLDRQELRYLFLNSLTFCSHQQQWQLQLDESTSSFKKTKIKNLSFRVVFCNINNYNILDIFIYKTLIATKLMSPSRMMVSTDHTAFEINTYTPLVESQCQAMHTTFCTLKI